MPRIITSTHMKYFASAISMALLIAGCGPAPAPQPTSAPTEAATATTAPVPTSGIVLAAGEWAPYTSETLQKRGAFTEIVSAVFKEMGETSIYIFYPWKRAEAETLAGNLFAAFPYIETDERLKDDDFSDPVMASTGKFFYMPAHQKNAISCSELTALKNYTIGGVLGYWYENPFKEAGLKVDYTNSDEQNIQKLSPQQVEQFAAVEKPLNQSELRLMISRKYPGASEPAQHFNSALKSIQDKGILQEI